MNNVLNLIQSQLNVSTSPGFTGLSAAEAAIVIQTLSTEDLNSLPVEFVALADLEDATARVDAACSILESAEAVMTASLTDGGMSMEMLQVQSGSLNAACSLLGLNNEDIDTESLNNADARLEYTEEKIMDIKGNLVKAYAAIKRFIELAIDKLAELWKRYITKAGQLSGKAAKLEAAVKELKGKNDAKEIKVSSVLSVGSKIATVSDLNKIAKAIESGKADGLNKAIKSLSHAFKSAKVDTAADVTAANKAIADAYVEITDAIVTAWSLKGKPSNVEAKTLPDSDEYESVVAGETFAGNFLIVAGIPKADSTRSASITVLSTKDKGIEGGQAVLSIKEIGSYSSAVTAISDAVSTLDKSYDVEEIKSVSESAGTLAKAISDSSIKSEDMTTLSTYVKEVKNLTKLIREPTMSVTKRAITVAGAAFNYALTCASGYKS